MDRYVQIIHSYFFPGGINTEIKCLNGGLPDGTILVSPDSKKEWRIKCRIIFSHTETIQKRFENETESYLCLSFESETALLNSYNKILEEEKNNIFQYLIEPVNHHSKPKKNEQLLIK